ncbi:MAG TPA: M48 family metallopeptidase [Elusimicrobiota bacterium]|nr:M48 family metallopeptidase [Elusimicrobiota bacterium]
MNRVVRGTVGTCVAVVLAGAACVRNPVTNRREAQLISENAERQIGLETKAQLVEEYGEFHDPVLQSYVEGIGNKLVTYSDRPRLPFVFTILDSDIINAFAVPGGYVFVTRGLLEELTSEAELAIVLGHEVGHVCAWHSVNMIEKQMGYGVLGTLGAIAGGVTAGPEAMIMIAQTAGLFTDLYLLGYSREYELEADRVGTRYAISAGYNPEAALAFFERLLRLEKQEGLEKWDTFFRTHPPTDARILECRRYIENMSVGKRELVEGFDAYQDMKLRLPHLAGDDRGKTEGASYINAKWGIRLSLPDQWIWTPPRRRALILFREQRDGGGWGELRRQVVGTGVRARDYAEKVARQEHWMLLNGRDVYYPAGYGYLGQYQGPGWLGGTQQYKALFVVREETGYVVLCAVTPESIAKYLIPFEQILRSFRID